MLDSAGKPINLTLGNYIKFVNNVAHPVVRAGNVG